MDADRYEAALRALAAAQATAGEQPQPPCPAAAVERLRAKVHAELGAALPDDYCALLRRQDGLNHNGLFVYGSRTAPIAGAGDAVIAGVVDANLGWRDDPFLADWLVLSEGNMDLYLATPDGREFRVIDRTPGNVIAAPGSFAELMTIALESHV